MKNLILVIKRELVERAMLMLGALAIGIIILIVPLFMNARVREVWNMTSLFASIVFGLGIVAFAASSFVASDQRERRMSFYLGRPLSAPALWTGKMLAAGLLGLICALLVLLPVSLFGSGLVFWVTVGEGGPAAFLLAVACAVFLIPVGHAAGVSLRARTAWLLADFVSLALFGLLTWAALRPFFMGYAFGLLGSTLLVTAGILVIAVAAGGYYGFSRGRFDLRKTHERQSLVTSAAMIAIGIAISGFAIWVRGIDARDVTRLELGRCMSWNCQPVFRGTSPARGDYLSQFVMSGDSFRRLDSASDVRVAPETGRVVWNTVESIEPPVAHVSYLDPGMAEPVHTKVTTHPYQSWIAISPGGDRIAVAQNETVQVIDLAQERVLRTFRIRGTSYFGGLWFPRSDSVLVVGSAGRGPTREWTGIAADLVSGETREVSFEAYPQILDPERGMIVSMKGKRIVAYSTDSWEPVVRTDGESAASTSHGLLVSRPSRDQIALINMVDGSERVYPVPSDVTDIAFGPVDGDDVILGLTRRSRIPRSGRGVPDSAVLVSLDLATGEIREMATGLLPVRAFDPGVSGPYFLRNSTEGQQIVRMNLETRELTVLTGKAS